MSVALNWSRRRVELPFKFDSIPRSACSQFNGRNDYSRLTQRVWDVGRCSPWTLVAESEARALLRNTGVHALRDRQSSHDIKDTGSWEIRNIQYIQVHSRPKNHDAKGLLAHHPMSWEMSSGGYFVCEKVNNLDISSKHVNSYPRRVIPYLFKLWMYFLLTSSFRTWATWSDEIFSRADRS